MVEEEEEDPPPYASLIAISDDAKSILHVDQSTKQFDKFGIKKVPLDGPTISLRYSNSILGRILMAKDNVTRAKTQVADLALDLPSGESWIFFSLSSRLARRVFIIYKCVNEERDTIHSSEMRAFSSFLSTFVFSVLRRKVLTFI